MSGVDSARLEVSPTFQTIPEAILHSAKRDKCVKLADRNRLESLPWSHLLSKGERAANVLTARDLGIGARIALISPTCLEAIVAIEGIWLAGCTLVVLPLPSRRLQAQDYVDEIVLRLRAASIQCILYHRQYRAFADLLLERGYELLELDTLAENVSSSTPSYDSRPESIAVIQFTSGSTRASRGVCLTHANILASLTATSKAIDYDADRDAMISWLPLFHDMGLLGCLGIPLLNGGDLVIADVADFRLDPLLWFHMAEEVESAVTAAPNFAYSLAEAAAHRSNGRRVRLSAFRLMLNASEMIDQESIQRFERLGQTRGLRENAVSAAYGLAEATLAVALTRRMVFDSIDSESLAERGIAEPSVTSEPSSKALAIVGEPIPGMEVMIMDERGTDVPEREVGEICIRGPAVAESFLDGSSDRYLIGANGRWLRTGDLGYRIQNTLVVCGRSADVIVIAGTNFFPEDLERVAASAPGVRRGNAAAFSMVDSQGRQRLGLVVEAKEGVDPGMVQRDVMKRVATHFGTRPILVEVWEAGSLFKTPSGKIQRSRIRHQIQESSERK